MNVNKKAAVKPPLSMVEIITRADVATIEAALEGRRKIDELLAERAAAYERIAALERQVDDVLGAEGVFAFPAPSVSVAPFAAAPAPVASKPSPSVQASPRAEAVKPGPQASDHADASGKKTPSGKSGN